MADLNNTEFNDTLGKYDLSGFTLEFVRDVDYVANTDSGGPVVTAQTIYATIIDSDSGIIPPVVVRINQPPVITSVVPAPPSNITATTPIQFDVTDPQSNINRIILVATFPTSKIKEVIFDGSGFGPMYTNASNTQVAISGGYSFTILRDGGWILNDGPTITPFVLDLEGLENA